MPNLIKHETLAIKDKTILFMVMHLHTIHFSIVLANYVYSPIKMKIKIKSRNYLVLGMV